MDRWNAADSGRLELGRWLCLGLVAGAMLLSACDSRPSPSAPRARFSSQTSFVVSGRVTYPDGRAFAGATVEALAAGGSTVAASALTGPSGDYSLDLGGGSYDFRVTPAAGSGYQVAIVTGRTIEANSTLDFVLVAAGSFTVHGQVLDGAGNGLANQRVDLRPLGGGMESTYTGPDGSYAFTVTPGDYRLQLMGTTAGAAAPLYYSLAQQDSMRVRGDTVVDLRLPVRRVEVRVQDPAGQPLAHVGVTTLGVWNGDVLLGGGHFSGISNNPPGNLPLAETDASGVATLWLFPTPPGQGYALTAAPPADSPFGPTTETGVAVSAERTVTIVLARPVLVQGRVLDGAGNGLANQRVDLRPLGGGMESTYTGPDGSYAFTVTPGDYRLQVTGSPAGAAAPLYYSLAQQDSMRVRSDTVVELRLPVRRVEVRVQDFAGQPLEHVGITTLGVWNGDLLLGGGHFSGMSSNPPGNLPLAETDASGVATLWLFPTPPGQGYALTAAPPADSPFGPTTETGVAVSAERTVTIVLARPVLVQGRVLDGAGNGLADQRVDLRPLGGGMESTYTGPDGSYAFTVTPGDYRLQLMGTTAGAAAPLYYSLAQQDSMRVRGDTVVDLRLPVRRVEVRVQDPAGQPLAHVGVTTLGVWNADVQLGGGHFSGISNNPPGNLPLAETDASGATTLWLFPTPAGPGYTLTVTPPPALPFGPLHVVDVAVTGDLTRVIVLQFAHDAPVTTAVLSPAPVDGKYVDPVTVTLGAAAASGHTVAATKYRIDGGAEAPYAAPFTVGGLGDHTLDYWSVDEAGVYETPRHLSFTVGVTHASLCTLVERVVTKQGVAKSLCARLEAAQAALEKGNVGAHNNQLDAFIHEVEAQAGKSIAASDADQLLAAARALKK